MQISKKKSIENAKKNLKHKIENHFDCFNFVTLNRKLHVYIDSFKELIIQDYFSLKNDFSLSTSLSERNKNTIINAGLSVIDEIRNMKYTMP